MTKILISLLLSLWMAASLSAIDQPLTLAVPFTDNMIPTYAYNWCVSPLTPMAVAGVIWIPSESNIGNTPAHYAAELEIYAKSLTSTYGQKEIPFLYAQPASSLVEGITKPNIPAAKNTTFVQWPKSLKQIAKDLAKQINQN